MPYRRTVDGIEAQIATNHLGPFALTGLLLPRIRDRIVTVSSHAHRQGRIDPDHLNYTHDDYDPSAGYARSKLANLLFAYELHRRLTAAGLLLRSLAAHPGLAQSNLMHQAAATRRLRFTALAQRRLGQPTDKGALPLLYAASADLPGGSYVGPDGLLELRGHPKIVNSNAPSKDPQTAAQLWQASQHLTGVVYDFTDPADPRDTSQSRPDSRQ